MGESKSFERLLALSIEFNQHQSWAVTCWKESWFVEVKIWFDLILTERAEIEKKK